MGSTISVPRHGARMEIPMRAGQQAAWPVSTLPLESLEAAAQDWYAFRDRSCAVKCYNSFACFMVMFFVSIFLVAIPPVAIRSMQNGMCAGAMKTDRCVLRAADDVDLCTAMTEHGVADCHFVFLHGREMCLTVGSVCEDDPVDTSFDAGYLVFRMLVTFSFIGMIIYIKCCMLRRLRDEAQRRLATPLTQLLAGTGWVVKARSQRRNKGTRAPEGLDQGCCSAGWLWLDFEPADAMPIVGAPTVASMQLSSVQAAQAPVQLQPFQVQPFAQQHFQQGAGTPLTAGAAHMRPLAPGVALGYILPAGGGTAPHAQDPDIVRASELQPVMAQAAPPDTPYQSMA